MEEIKIMNNVILSPMEHGQFLDQFWESQPLHIERTDSHYFKNLLSEELILNHVQNGAASFPDVQAINARKAVPFKDYTTDNKSVRPDKLMQCYAQGATIVVAEVHKKFNDLQNLCVQFSKDFRVRCQANAYLSPAGNQGFHSHYDTHDVFVLQVAGRKKFRFYKSIIELPFTEDTYTPENNTSTDMEDEVELSAGDTLYIPRGVVHDAIADEGEPSLHITLGAFPFVLRDLVQEMIQVAAERDVVWRSSIDLTTQGNSPADLYQQAVSVFSDSVYDEALSRLADEVALAQPQDSVSVPAFSLESQFLVNHERVHGVNHSQGILILRLAGIVLRFEAPLSMAVDSILGAQNLIVGDIPTLDNDQKLALCQQLAESGAITFGNNA